MSVAVLAAPGAWADGGRAFSWTGLYVGAHVGHASADMDWGLAYTNPGFFNASDLPGVFNFANGGVIGGGQIGLQYQSGRWVVGGEVSLSSGFSGDRISGVDLWQGTGVGHLETSVDWLVLATGRIGYASNGWLGYVKGGYAGAMISISSDDNVPPDFGFTDRRMHHGWTVGAGLDYVIAAGVTLGVEYNYVDLSADVKAPVLNIGSGTQVGGAFANSSVDTNIHSVSARLNFLLGAK